MNEVVQQNKALEAANKQLAATVAESEERMRIALEETRLKAEETEQKISVMQRGLNCLEKLLGLRRFRQLANANRGHHKSAVLDQLCGRTAESDKSPDLISPPSLIDYFPADTDIYSLQVISWFKQLSVSELKVDNLRSFFAENNGNKNAKSVAAKQCEPVDKTSQSSEDVSMEVDDDEELLEIYN